MPAENMYALERTLFLPADPRNSEGDFIQLRDGRWMFVYSRFQTGTGGDHDAADLAARYSEDDGKTWSTSDLIVVSNDGAFNIMSVTLRRLPLTGEIALFYLRKNSMRDCRPVLRLSGDEGETWSPPIEIIPETEIGYCVVVNDRVLRLPSGRMIVPVALHQDPEGAFLRIGRVICYLSDDFGKSWRRNRTVLSLPVPDTKTGLQEPGVVELRNGRLLLWARTDQGTPWHAWSDDDGETFGAPQSGSLRSSVSPASIKSMPESGNLLAVWNDSYDPKLGLHSGARTPLAAAASRDDGETCERKTILEGDPAGFYCYTAIAFAGEGPDRQILLAYGTRNGAPEGLSLQISRIPASVLSESAI